MPYLLNKTFSAKRKKGLQETVYCLTLDTYTRYVAASTVADRQTHTHTHTMTTITLVHAPRLKYIFCRSCNDNFITLSTKNLCCFDNVVVVVVPHCIVWLVGCASCCMFLVTTVCRQLGEYSPLSNFITVLYCVPYIIVTRLLHHCKVCVPLPLSSPFHAYLYVILAILLCVNR